MRQHPVAFFRYTYKKFWLLAIPFIRALTHGGEYKNILKSSLYIDVVIMAVIVISAVVRWYNIQIITNENGITFKSGMIVKRELYIPFSSVSMVKTGELFLVKPFDAAVVFIYTDAETGWNKRRNPNQRLLLKLTDYQQLFNKLPNNILNEKRTCSLPKGKLLIYSFAFSSVLSGTIYLSALLFHVGSTMKNELEMMFVSAVNDVARIAEKVISDITPFTAAVIVIIVISWIISFGSNYFRNVNFISARHEKMLMTMNGYFYKTRNFIDIEKVSFIDIKQKLMMKVFGVAQVILCCSENTPMIIPFCSKKNISDFIKILIPEMYCEVESFSGRKQFMRYMAAPLFMMYSVIAAGAAAVMIFPEWYRLIFFTAIMLEITVLHFYAVRIISYFTSGAECNRNSVSIKYSSFLSFHHVIIPLDRAAELKITSTLLQRISSSCDLSFYSAGKIPLRHRIRGLKIYDAERIALKIFKENYNGKQK